MTTLGKLCSHAQQSLAPRFGEGEARWMVRLMMEHLKGYSTVDLALKSDLEVTPWLERKVSEVTSRLLADEPLQYIFSQARFYGLNIIVTPAVLIPRPETEELVDLIVKQASDRSDLRVLDACTGSGCIALALARNLPFSRVDAFDLSPEALEIARENNVALRTSVHFSHADALNLEPLAQPRYDIVVSNPPYIARREEAEMAPNVLRYEPHAALFVPDDDPLCFYRSIAHYACSALVDGGELWFEINPLFARELEAWMRSQGWTEVALLPDMQRKLRFLNAKRPAR